MWEHPSGCAWDGRAQKGTPTSSLLLVLVLVLFFVFLVLILVVFVFLVEVILVFRVAHIEATRRTPEVIALQLRLIDIAITIWTSQLFHSNLPSFAAAN